MARTAGTRAGDFTGRQKEELAAKAAAKQEAEARSVADAAAALAGEASNEPIDVKPTEKPVVEEPEATDVEITDVDVEEPKRTFRVNEDIEQMTFGYGNHYDFKMGQVYTAPVSLYDHLEEKGLVYH